MTFFGAELPGHPPGDDVFIRKFQVCVWPAANETALACRHFIEKKINTKLHDFSAAPGDNIPRLSVDPIFPILALNGHIRLLLCSQVSIWQFTPNFLQKPGQK
jgi:hypothetical protein